MSILESPRQLHEQREPARQASRSADDSTLRTIGALTLLGIGAMHFLQIVATFQETPLLGWAYLLFIVACLVIACALITRGDRRTWVGAGIVGIAAIGAYLFTRLFSTPLDDQDVGNWACMLGLAALFVETSVLLTSGYALASGQQHPADPTRSAGDIHPAVAVG